MRYKTQKIEMYDVIDTDSEDQVVHRTLDKDEADAHRDQMNEQHATIEEMNARIAAGEDLSASDIEVDDSVGVNDNY